MNEALASFDQITEMVNQMFNLNSEIAAASERQTSASENILENINNISLSTIKTTENSSKVMLSGKEFESISSNLTELVSHYRL